ncbi:hypothetical protein PanWU01x14_166160 [Parasponia andersonii]|uniref:Uncharacterized protein n=1 Tax=Parasponia andersonii TaxID=3476 RepID=A0A2P5CBN9_PARAD|nr:hypothetical protein PanWU01x14_166160 [Parasponia andersonii]
MQTNERRVVWASSGVKQSDEAARDSARHRQWLGRSSALVCGKERVRWDGSGALVWQGRLRCSRVVHCVSVLVWWWSGCGEIENREQYSETKVLVLSAPIRFAR